MMKQFSILVLMSLTLVSCLRTRGELSEAEIREKTVAQQRAEAVNRLEDMNEKFQHMNGKIEALDNKISRLEANRGEEFGKRNADQELLASRLKAYDEEIQKLQAEVAELKAEAKAASAAPKKEAPAGKAGAKVNHFAAGEASFSQKDWQTAIVSYQKYRENNPKGKTYLEATYKIGVSFMELGMKDEAKSFFEEVQQKAPKSGFGSKAQANLKKLR